jgi:uncharacterized protein
LSALFAGPGPAPAAPGPATQMPRADAAQAALDDYNQALERLKSGDWAGFGAQMEAMRGLLEKLARQSGDSNGGKSP